MSQGCSRYWTIALLAWWLLVRRIMNERMPSHPLLPCTWHSKWPGIWMAFLWTVSMSSSTRSWHQLSEWLEAAPSKILPGHDGCQLASCIQLCEDVAHRLVYSGFVFLPIEFQNSQLVGVSTYKAFSFPADIFWHSQLAKMDFEFWRCLKPNFGTKPSPCATKCHLCSTIRRFIHTHSEKI